MVVGGFLSEFSVHLSLSLDQAEQFRKAINELRTTWPETYLGCLDIGFGLTEEGLWMT